MSRFVLIAVTAGDCIHCKAFKSEYYDIIKRTLDMRKFDIKHVIIPLPKRESHINPTVFPVDVTRHIPYFPALFLMKEDVWDAAMLNNDTRLNTKFDVSQLSVMDNRFNHANPEDVVSWINESIDRLERAAPRISMSGTTQVPITYIPTTGGASTTSCRMQIIPRYKTR